MRLQQFVAIAWIAIALAGAGVLIGLSAESIIESQAAAKAIFMAGRRTMHEWPLCVQDWKHPVEKIDVKGYSM